jgi:multidrug efflux pump subunit AcrA (membrane-fusion protein)
MRNHKSNIHSLIQKYDTPEFSRILARLFIIFFLFGLILCIFIPWQQTTQGTGKVIAYSPQERVQNIHANVSGRVKKWFVQEGQSVKKNDPILEMEDLDPLFMTRLEQEKNSKLKQLSSAVSVSKAAELNFNRTLNLLEKGIASKKEYEDSEIAFKNAQSQEAEAQAEVTRIESRLERQKSQMIEAPADGTIVRLKYGASKYLIKEGDVIAVFAPDTSSPAVEVFISGNDLPLVYEGRKVRLQFEGWPAVQFAGWPSVAIGTFGGIVKIVDQSASLQGGFRVVITPEPNSKWPEKRFLRQGTRVNSWVILNQVPLGYEIWRQFNGFPPHMENPPELTEVYSGMEEKP